MYLLRALVVWVLLMIAETIHGIIRNLALVPITGDFSARQIGVFTGAAIIFGITFIFVRWLHAATKAKLLLIGMMWLTLTLIFEFCLGSFVLGLSWERITEDYNLLQGGLLPFGLLFMVLSPLLAAKLRQSV